MEFDNYERELKYLLTENSKLSRDQILQFLNGYGYEIVEIITKEKHESYYDDKTFTLLSRGDVMRGSKHITAQVSGFMYKKNVSDSSKPYVSKIEIASGQYRTIKDFIADLDIDVKVQSDPVLYAKMIRDVAIVAKGSDRLLICYDKVDYFNNVNAPGTYEEMLEIEDWNRPNTTDVDYDYDSHLLEVNNILLNGGLPIILTKHSKYDRGYIVLNEKH